MIVCFIRVTTLASPHLQVHIDLIHGHPSIRVGSILSYETANCGAIWSASYSVFLALEVAEFRTHFGRLHRGAVDYLTSKPPFTSRFCEPFGTKKRNWVG